MSGPATNNPIAQTESLGKLVHAPVSFRGALVLVYQRHKVPGTSPPVDSYIYVIQRNERDFYVSDRVHDSVDKAEHEALLRILVPEGSPLEPPPPKGLTKVVRWAVILLFFPITLPLLWLLRSGPFVRQNRTAPTPAEAAWYAHPNLNPDQIARLGVMYTAHGLSVSKEVYSKALVAVVCACEWYIDPLILNDRLVNDLGFDSLGVVEIIMGIEERLGIHIKDEEAQKAFTIGDVIKLIVEKIHGRT